MTIHQDFYQLSIASNATYPDIRSLESVHSKLLTEKYPQKIFELVKGVGSPLHCVFPQQFMKNIASLQSVLNKHGIAQRIFFAKKANKAQGFAKACVEAGIGIDVASKQEFELALAAGVTGANLSVSGPEKNITLLQLAIYHGAQISVDSLEELQKIISLIATKNDVVANKLSKTFKPKILLRYQPICETGSRFGITGKQLPIALELIEPCQDHIILAGFSFHLSGYDFKKRAEVASELVKWVNIARGHGFVDCHQINIGGGLPVKYTHMDEWQQFLTSITAEHFHSNKAFRHGFYPYGNVVDAPLALDFLLTEKVENYYSLAQELRENKIQFAIEPGRALLDQAGISIFDIQGLKKIDHENPYWIATVDGMSFSLSEQWFGSEFLPAPILLKPDSIKNNHVLTESIFPTAIAGSSCLECDMLSWRKIPFIHKPAVNDCLIYLNTAGYQMDSNESAFHSIPIIPKVALWFDDENMHWQLDSNV